ncbi:hypothetical protein AGMMS49543_20810 [Betaproteobacteria bacterium]|nr:hypothetical protein AGMMS49543_20810 [Betaproteobacteria bacterium]
MKKKHPRMFTAEELFEDTMWKAREKVNLIKYTVNRGNYLLEHLTPKERHGLLSNGYKSKRRRKEKK